MTAEEHEAKRRGGAAARSAPRVLVVSHEASRTGAPKVALDLLAALRHAGWEAVVWHRWGGPLEADLDAAASRSVVQPANRLRLALRRLRPARSAAAALDRWGIGRVLRRERPDLVWANTTMTARVAAEAQGQGIATVLYVHEQEWARPLLEAVGPSTLATMTLVGCSAEAAALASDCADGAPARVLRPAVDVAALRRRAGVDERRPPPVALASPPVVVGCGTADHRKGFDVFCAAAQLAGDAGQRWRWRWVGRHDLATPPPGVELAGEVASTAAELAAASTFVLTSRAEAFPLVVLEAMALGRPIVASDLAGPAEQLGDAGLLVAPGEPAALVEAVGRVLGDPALAARLGAEAAARCEQRWAVGPFGEEAAAIAARAVDGHGAPPVPN